MYVNVLAANIFYPKNTGNLHKIFIMRRVALHSCYNLCVVVVVAVALYRTARIVYYNIRRRGER